MAGASIQQDSPWLIISSISAGSTIALLAVVILCTYCFKKKVPADYGDADGDYVDYVGSSDLPLKEPLMKSSSGSSKRSQSEATPDSRLPSGYGKKNMKFENGIFPVETVFESIGIQPKPKELNCSYDSLQSSLSSIPAEPEAGVDRGEELGSIYFSLSYDSQDLVLKLTIQKAVNLPAKDLSGTSDPFVKVLLLPDKKNKLETRVKRKKLNPIWNEVFTFEGFPHAKLLQRILYLQVLDYDRFSRNDPIGEVELPMSEVSLQIEPVPFVKKLNPCKRASNYLGDLLISMCYNPTSSRITIIVMKCSNLKVMDLTGSCDPYVKVYLVFAGKRIDKKKTSIKRRSLNPVWNETFEFDVPIDKIREISFILTVIDFDRILPNEAIGQVVIGYRTAGSSLKHWTEMMNHPRKGIAMWHKIIKY